MSLTARLDPRCLEALELAKRGLPDGAPLDAETLLRAVYHGCGLKDDAGLAELSGYIPALPPLRPEAGKVNVDGELRDILTRLPDSGLTTPVELFGQLVRCAAFLRRVPQEKIVAALDRAGQDKSELVAPHPTPPAPQPPTPLPPPPPRSKPERLLAFRQFGRVLTEAEASPRMLTAIREKLLENLLVYLLVPRFRNVFLVGPPGVGKTSLIQILVQKVRARDGSLPEHFYNMDILELSPAFPRGSAGEGTPGLEYDLQRIRTFFRVLETHRGLVLFIDNMFGFIMTLMRTGLHQELVDSFQRLLASGDVSCIGCLFPQELTKLAEVAPSLARQFRALHLVPPTGPELEGIVNERRQAMEKYFQLSIPEALSAKAISLTDQHLTDRQQPEKTLRLLEAAAARAAMAKLPAMTAAHLLEAVEGFVGAVVLPGRPLTQDEIATNLKAAIVGQDDVLDGIAAAVLGARSDKGWFMRPGPRGTFLFGGPTGVGKTETALVLARMLSNGREALVRVDCQGLQGSGTGREANTITWRLLGVAPGYMGHVPGCRDGILTRVRDFPECVLLFDEFEKADPAVGRLILRILDEGKAQDSEGNELDFRRCFVILTSNAGVTYSTESGMGFHKKAATIPAAALDDLFRQLADSGLGQEFLGRIQHFFLFNGLGPDAIREIVRRRLADVQDQVRARGKELTWSAGVIDYLADLAKKKQNLGVRYVLTVVRSGILDPLNAAVHAGEIDDTVSAIELALPDAGAEKKLERDGTVIRLRIA
jgi:ATP-dependent Clp protease ATP-binding subunit ClpA